MILAHTHSSLCLTALMIDDALMLLCHVQVRARGVNVEERGLGIGDMVWVAR